jgi:hypothetical protein
MEPITEEHIEAAANELKGKELTQAEDVMVIIHQDQPAVMDFISGEEHADLNEDEREFLIYFTVLTWLAFKKAYEAVPPVSEDLLREVEDGNVSQLESLQQQDNESMTSDMVDLVENFFQRPLLQYIIQGIMVEGEQDEDMEISEDNQGIMVFSLKTVIEAFDKVTSERLQASS